jgi:hypothetical protein
MRPPRFSGATRRTKAMATESISAKVRPDIRDRLAEFAEDEDASLSGAAERCLDEGLRQFGYADGLRRRRGLRVRFLRELAKGLLWTGALLFALTLVTALSLQFTAAALWLIASVCIIAAQAGVVSLADVREVVSA